MTTLEEISKFLQMPDRVRIYKDDKEVFIGYWASFFLQQGMNESEKFKELKGEEVKKFRCIPELNHSKWKSRGLMPPSEPNEPPDFISSDDMEMKLYYNIWI